MENPVPARGAEPPVSGTLAWIAAFMLIVSMVNTLFRPDPTVVVCVLGMYAGGRPDSSAGTVAAFALATLLTLVTDTVWWLTDSTVLIHSLADAEEFNHLPRSIQMPACLTALNVVYKLIVIPFSLFFVMPGRRRRTNERPVDEQRAGGDLR